jgi:hypothetical protein
MDWHGLILSVAAKGCSALALRMGSCAVRGQVMVLAMLLETVFWHVESGLSWKPRRWGRHCTRASIPHQQTLCKFYEWTTTLKAGWYFTYLYFTSDYDTK